MLKYIFSFFKNTVIIPKADRLYYFLIYILFVSLLSSCMGVKFLKTNEKILHSQSIKGAKGFKMEDIESLYENKPNKRLPLLPVAPYIYLYQDGLRKFDPEKYEAKKEKLRKKYERKIEKANDNSKKEKKLQAKLVRKIDKQDKNIKEGNLGMRIGEPLAVYDTTLERVTVEKLKSYFDSRGYFNAEVSYSTEPIGEKMVKVIYEVNRRKYYLIDSIYYGISDSKVKNLLISTNTSAHVQKGHVYNQENIVKERERITDLMLNNGYYDFNRQFLNFQVDTAYLGNNKVTIGILIKNPPKKEGYKVYKLDSVIFTTDADIKGVRSTRQQATYNTVSYQFYKKRYAKRLMDWRVFIYPDSIYSKANTLETQRQFSNLDIFKFINVNYDTTGGKFIANIFTSPLQKYQTSTEGGINVSQGLPGPFVNFNLKNRNTFKGLEVMELNGRVGFEGLGGASKSGNGYSSLEYGVNLTFTFPQFLFPFGEKFKSRIGRYNPQTKIISGLTYTDRPEYLRSNISSSMSYNWQNRQDRIYNLTIADVSYIISDITSESFRKTLEEYKAQGNNLINSFSNSFVSSTKFAVINNYNDYGNKKQKSSYLRYSLEVGGNLFKLLGEQYLEEGVEQFQFAKIRTDYRSTVPINSKESFAYRFHVGYALPYGENKTLPYEKFFFAGGSNSVRAWEPRRLGPGSYYPADTLGNYSNNFEQQGEILFESSIEYRHKIFGFVYGAIFVDAGNIWTVREDGSRPGAHFEFDRFYKEIAVGSGYGLRFDFNFLLMRFDVGMKIYDPSGPPGAKFIGDAGFKDPSYKNYERLVFNIGIGYPF
ncbi:BamA/TamA family outer membrane protein [Reichenbachiella sp. MALMAid0571]|uniref:translocation and assembly module lipoprotein TamL n=1 Tax=Reichenbachiella sp. MALMAid0571 TaxID=3143939 RepID=UPI0032E04630